MRRLSSMINTSGADFRRNDAYNRGLLATFRAKQEQARNERPQRDLDRLAKQGKMRPRERIEKLLDPGTPFLELSALRLIGTPLSVILPFAFFPVGVYLTSIYFSTAVSKDRLNAARVDGAGELRVFAQVAMPLATPVIALVGFFNFVGNWNNYFLPFLMVGGQKIPVQVGLANMLSNVPQFNPTTAASTVIELPTLALATLLSVLPVLIIFLFSQRFLVEGMTAGGTKG